MQSGVILSSGSHGNCVMMFDTILIDLGVPFSIIKDVYKQIQLITWSHLHHDHFNKKTIEKLISLRPTIRVAVCKHEYERALECGAKNIDILENGKWYNYGKFQIATFKTYHDVESNGYRLISNNKKIFFATDTFTLEGVSAIGYDEYYIESNYNEETIFDQIKAKEDKGEFCHLRGAINSHLSEQQARNFFFENKGENSQLIRLHESKSK